MARRFVRCATRAPLLWLAGSLALAQSAPDFRRLDLYVDEFARKQPQGAALVLAQNGRILYERRSGGAVLDEPRQVGSAIKIVTAALLSALDEERVLSLNGTPADPKQSAPAGASVIRLWHLLSHTSGLPMEYACFLEGQASTAECAERLLAEGGRSRPGAVFDYANAPYQVAAAAAEKATGRGWREIFERILGGPMGLRCTDVMRHSVNVSSPAAANEAVSCLNDFVRIYTLLAQRGALEGRRVLPARAVARLLENRVSGTAMLGSPLAPFVNLDLIYRTPSYGLGAFLDRYSGDGRPQDAVTPGSRGMVPWLDSERNLAGVLYSPGGGLDTAFPAYVEVKRIVAQIVPPVPLNSAGIVNAFSSENTSLVPGSFVTFYGNRLADRTLTVSPDSATAELGGVSILLESEPAPLFHVSPGQVNAIVPLSLRGRETARVTLVRNGVREASFEHPVQSVAPGIFPVIFDTRWQPVSIFRPARAGDHLVVFLNGAGVGQEVTDPLAASQASVERGGQTLVLVDGAQARLLFHGTPQGMFPGTTQLNLQLGQFAPGSTALPLTVVVDGVATQAGLSIPVE
jgi:uncharacterized protein (TIGR03437 family)